MSIDGAHCGGWLIFALWLTLVVYWALAARAMARSTGGRWVWWRELAVRLGFFALVVLAAQVASIGHAWPDAPRYAFNSSASMGGSGAVLCALGIGLSILGRHYLTRDRYMPVGCRRDPPLVTTGPYALVRHPFYAGLILAMLGSAVGQSLLWLLPLLVYTPHFIRSARREEQRLIEQFPDGYRAYMDRTRMLLPFVR